MVVIVPFLHVRGMALFPFILLKYADDRYNAPLLNHERIHHRQQLELLVLPFYAWYGLEYAVRRLRHRSHYAAYRNLSFEREAFSQEYNLTYLTHRPFAAFLRYYGARFRYPG